MDVWSIGCIFAELILSNVLFQGTDHVDQWTKIVEKLGTPEASFTSRLQPTVRSYVENRPRCDPQLWEALFPTNAFPEDFNDRLNGLDSLLP